MNNKPVHPGGFGATNGFRQLGQTPVGLWGAEAPPTHTRPPATGLSSTPVTPGEAAAEQRCHEATETAPVSLVKAPAAGRAGSRAAADKCEANTRSFPCGKAITATFLPAARTDTWEHVRPTGLL